jgi:hypothetical protein
MLALRINLFHITRLLLFLTFGVYHSDLQATHRCLINRPNYHMNLMYRSPYPSLGALIPDKTMGCLRAAPSKRKLRITSGQAITLHPE